MIVVGERGKRNLLCQLEQEEEGRKEDKIKMKNRIYARTQYC